VKNGSVDLPDEVPVMPLPGAVLFPNALLPLYIFEQRYREMLADLVASTFVEDPLRRQRMLEEASLNKRLRLLITYLQDEIGSTAI